MKITQTTFLCLLLFVWLPVSNPGQTNEEKRAILRQLVADDKDAREAVQDAGGIYNSLDKLIIERADISGDGRPEFIVDAMFLCGASNCAIYIYQRTADGYRRLLDGSGTLHKVLSTKTNGYNDIRIEAHSSA